MATLTTTGDPQDDGCFTCQFCGSHSNKQHRNDMVCWSCYKYAHDRHMFPSLWKTQGVAQKLASLFLSQPICPVAESESLCKAYRHEIFAWLQIDMNRQRLELQVPELCNAKYRKILPYLVRYTTGDYGEKGDIRKAGLFSVDVNVSPIPAAHSTLSRPSYRSVEPNIDSSKTIQMPGAARPTVRGSAPSSKGKRKRKPYAELTAEQKARRIEAVQRCRRKKADKKTDCDSLDPCVTSSSSSSASNICSAATTTTSTGNTTPRLYTTTTKPIPVRGIARGQRKIMRIGSIFTEFVVSDTTTSIIDLEQHFRTALTIWGQVAVEQRYPVHCLPNFFISPKEARIRSQRFGTDRIFVKVVIELDGDADLRDNRDRGLAFKDSLYTLQQLKKDEWKQYSYLLPMDTAMFVKQMLRTIEVDIDGRSIPSRDTKPLWLCAWCHHFRLRKNTLSVCESCYKQANTHFPRIWDQVTLAIRDAMPEALQHSEHLDLALQILWPNMTSQKQELVDKIEPRLRNELTAKQTEILFELIEYTLTPRAGRPHLLKPRKWQYYYGRLGADFS